MSTSHNLCYLVGNLDSLHFRNRIEIIKSMRPDLSFRVINTKRTNILSWLPYFINSFKLIWLLVSRGPKLRIVFHGAYSPVFWLFALSRKTIIISIIQGSELYIDYRGIRKRFIFLILKNSDLIVCRNEAQCDRVAQLVDINPTICKIVNWGHSIDLLSIERHHRNDAISIISPRASQPEYNIDLIFRVLTSLKSEGYPLHFIYVRFNSTLGRIESDIVDEYLDNPSQVELCGAISRSDLCISIPDYDGLSNTIIECLALGTYPILSDLPNYNEVLNDRVLGLKISLDQLKSDFHKSGLEQFRFVLSEINKIRGSTSVRRKYAEQHLIGPSGLTYIKDALR